MERIDLLNKFHFLALPGAKEQKLRDKDDIPRKGRYYYYECIREAAVSQNKEIYTNRNNAVQDNG